MEFNDAATRPDGLRADPIRVIQAVALGIGFLGSGVIRSVKGSAASPPSNRTAVSPR